MTVAERLARIRAAEAATAERRAALPAVDVRVVVLDGRALLRVTRTGARVADYTPAEAARLLAEGPP